MSTIASFPDTPTSPAPGGRPALRRELLLAAGLWAPVGLLMAGSAAGNALRGGERPGWTDVADPVTQAVLMVAVTPVIFAAARRWPLAGPRYRPHHLSLHAGVYAALLVPAVLLCALTALSTHEAVPGFSTLLLGVLSQYTYVYVAGAGLGTALFLRREVREEELRARALAAHLVQVELADLHARLRPDFLFETLAAIERLIPLDPGAADRVVARLGVFLRYSLDAADATEAALEDEMAAVRAYLDVHAIPSGGRLRVSVDMAPDVMGMGVPPLVLQPLLAELLLREPRGEARVDVTATAAGDGLRITVRASGFVAPAERGDDDALRRIRSRLVHGYGAGAEVSARPLGDGGVDAVLLIPAAGVPAGGEPFFSVASPA